MMDRVGMVRCGLMFLLLASAGTLQGNIDYQSQVWPILKNKCLDCHSPKKRKGSFRVDSPERIQKGGKTGAAVIPGLPKKSPLYVMTTYPEDDPDFMPAKGEPLTKQEQEIVRQWIEQGALFEKGKPWGEPVKPKAEVNPDTRPGNEVAKLLEELDGAGVVVRSLPDNGWEVDYSHMDDADAEISLERIMPLKDGVRVLIFSRANLSAEDLKGLSEFRGLLRLNLKQTALEDSWLETLSGLEQLEVLNLYQTKVTDAAIPSLRNMGSLKRVYLHGTGVTEGGVEKLRSTRQNLKVSY